MDFGLIVDVTWKVGTLLGFGWMYMANRDKVTNARISKLEGDIDAKLDDHASRLTKVETEVKNTPTHADLGALHARVSDVAKGMNTMAGEMSGIKTTLNLIHQFLLNHGGKP